MLPSWANETITVKRAPYVESRGSTIRDWDRAVPHIVEGCSVQPTSTSGELAGRTNTTTRATCYLPYGADVMAGDRIIWEGTPYAIDGEPLPWKSPFGGASHLVANLVDWKG